MSFFFEDDISEHASDETKLQKGRDRFSQASVTYNRVVYQHASWRLCIENEFTYLESTSSQSVHIDD